MKMAELYQSDVDLAWSDATDDEPHVAPRAAVRARGTRPPPLPGLPPLRRALPLPPPVLPEATSTFGRLPAVTLRGGARNDATLIVRPLRDPRVELRPRRRWFAALAVLTIAAALVVVAVRTHRTAPPAARAPVRAVPEQAAVPSPPSESRVGASQPKTKPVAKHKPAATSKTVATTAPAKSTKAKAPPTKAPAKVAKKAAKKKAPDPSTKSRPAKSVTAKTSKQRRR